MTRAERSYPSTNPGKRQTLLPRKWLVTLTLSDQTHMPQTFVIGDIHGSYRALLQCLQLSRFDHKQDTLICLGDVADGWPETRQAFDELLKIDNLVYLLGNHDFWALEWMESGFAHSTWLEQGGQATVNSYSDGIPDSHFDLLKKAKPFHVRYNELFVHAGIHPNKPLESQGLNTFLWDRSFAEQARHYHAQDENYRLTSFDSVFVGHTPVFTPQPKQYCEVWMMDTGAGWSGRLSMMNVETRESFVSEPVMNLYPGIQGRKKF